MTEGNVPPKRIADVDQGIANIHKEIERKIQQKDESATGFSHELVEEGFVECSIYYSEFNSSSLEEHNCFYYALYDGNTNQVILYNDGIEAIRRLKDKLDSRRSLLQRVKEFSLFEMIMGMLAFFTTGVYLYLSITAKPPQELVGIVGIIIGHYFAQAKSAT